MGLEGGCDPPPGKNTPVPLPAEVTTAAIGDQFSSAQLGARLIGACKLETPAGVLLGLPAGLLRCWLRCEARPGGRLGTASNLGTIKTPSDNIPVLQNSFAAL